MKKGCADRYCWGSMAPGEGAEAPPEPTEAPEAPEAPGLRARQVSWLRRSSACGPCSRLGMGCRAVSGVVAVSGRGGLL